MTRDAHARLTRWGLIAAALLLIAACAGIPNEEAFRYNVKSWMDRSEKDLVNSWGPPASTFKMVNGNTVYTYNKGKPVADTCVVNFTINPTGKIVGWKYSGTTCRTTY